MLHTEVVEPDALEVVFILVEIDDDVAVLHGIVRQVETIHFAVGVVGQGGGANHGVTHEMVRVGHHAHADVFHRA